MFALANRRKTPRRNQKRAGVYWPKYVVYIITLSLFLFEFWAAATGYSNLANTQIALELIFLFMVFSYLMARGKRLGEAIKNLGLSRGGANPRNIGIGIGIFLFILAVELGIAVFSWATDIPLPSNADLLLGNMPLYFLVLSFTLAPLCEETLFRGFLVPRAGIWLSAIIFAALHFSYMSISETLVAFLFAVIAGYALRRTKSLYPSITAHVLVNFLSIITIIYAGG